MEGSLLFIGYSFRDQYIKQKLFNFKKDTRRKLWAVQPERGSTSDDRERLHEQFGITLIPTEFETLMTELEALRRKPILMASGSKKSRIQGGNERGGATNKIDQLCGVLSVGLENRNIKLLTGATATDKVGYMIGRGMQRENVTTYVWPGAGRELWNEVGKMISPKEVGGRPSAVIEKLLQDSTVLLVIGGGALTLREALTAISKGITVIPVSIGGSYASDLIHTLFVDQHKSFEVITADTALDANIGQRVTKILTSARLDKLQLNKHSVETVSTTILIILDHISSVRSEIYCGGD